MVAEMVEFVKTHLDSILMALIVILFVFCAFGLGYAIAKYEDRAPITITQHP